MLFAAQPLLIPGRFRMPLENLLKLHAVLPIYGVIPLVQEKCVSLHMRGVESDYCMR